GDGGAYPLLLDVVEHCGINNLVAQARASIDSRLGKLADALVFDAPPTAPENGPQTIGFLVDSAAIERRNVDAHLLAAAREQGYA
ncbi:hypothetical protein KC217_22655, partial [Mycobacterium tuberculosis]|nr:hypothetical protein [Mycobacterium tuberculosis]